MSSSRCRNVRKNHKTSTPSRVIFFDTETVRRKRANGSRQSLNTLKLGCLIDCHYKKGIKVRETILHFKKQVEFWDYLFRATRGGPTTYCVAHMASYDCSVLGLFDYIDSGLLQLHRPKQLSRSTNEEESDEHTGLILLKDPPFCVDCYTSRGKLRFLSSLNYFPCPLSELGESVGIPKIEVDFDTVPDSRLAERCESDCRILERMFSQIFAWWNDKDLGNFGITASGLAMNNFRHLHMKTPVQLNHDPDVIAFERSAYFGGRTECFFVGDILPRSKSKRTSIEARQELGDEVELGPLHEVDIKSAYPSVLLDTLLPFSHCRTIKKPTLWELEQWSKTHFIVAYCSLSTIREQYPLRFPENVFYCYGDYWTTLCGPELRRALEAGHVKDCAKCQVYAQSDILSSFASFWLGEREKSERSGNRAIADFCKRIANGLTGKWAQKGGSWKELKNVAPPTDWGFFLHDLPDGSKLDCRVLGGSVVHYWEPSEISQFCFPAISAGITSELRIRMDCVRYSLPANTVLAQHTDSFLLLDNGYQEMVKQRLIRPMSVGAFSLKGSAEYGSVFGAGFVSLEGKTRIASIPSNAKQVGLWSFAFDSILSPEAQIATGVFEGQITEEVIRTRLPSYRPHQPRIGGWLEPVSAEDAIRLATSKPD